MLNMDVVLILHSSHVNGREIFVIFGWIHKFTKVKIVCTTLVSSPPSCRFAHHGRQGGRWVLTVGGLLLCVHLHILSFSSSPQLEGGRTPGTRKEFWMHLLGTILCVFSCTSIQA